MNWYKCAQIIYRGDPNKISIEEYNPNYGVGEMGKERGASMRGGPGIYFTTLKEDAAGYGEHVSGFELVDASVLQESDPLFSTDQITQMISGVDRETMEVATSNWDEDFESGKSMLTKSIANGSDPIDQIMSIWGDVFSHQDAATFMNLMTKNGIDGIMMNRPYSQHYVIYNKDVLK